MATHREIHGFGNPPSMDLEWYRDVNLNRFQPRMMLLESQLGKT